jgi:shikimate dehydrogenase
MTYSDTNNIMSLYGLIGYPLSQSFSQQYFRKKFAEEKILYTDYETFPLKNMEEISTILHGNKNLKGLNVTIPYKEQVLQYVDKLSDAVQVIGAANCLKIEDGCITAYNTDIIGFEKSLQPLLKNHHTKALIIGTGGAAKAVGYVLNKLNINFLYVSRSKKNAATISYEVIDKNILQEYTLIINATPSGMHPNEHTFPAIPYEHINEQHLLYDLVYKPTETIFLQKGKQQGAIIKNGFEMLEIQAEEAWKIWISF